tara:strand:- start:1826 stop:1990 length:165 start_codon:yes stop_codon:yes gene_type:complete
MKVGDLVRLKYAKYTEKVAIVTKYNSWSGDCRIVFVDTGRIWNAAESALVIISQ